MKPRWIPTMRSSSVESFPRCAVRLFQKLEASNQNAKLDIYEGMWHVFQQAPMPETEVSLKKSAAFLNKYLGNK